MLLRLILVALVAALGLSLPDQRDLDTLGRATQRWMNDRLADWDTQPQSDRGTIVFVEEPADPSLASVRPGDIPQGEVDRPVERLAWNEHGRTGLEKRPIGQGREEIVPSASRSPLDLDLPTEPVPVAVDDSLRTDLASVALADSPVPATAFEMTVVTPNELDRVDLVFEGVLDEMAAGFGADATRPGGTVSDRHAEPAEVVGHLSEEGNENGSSAWDRRSDRVSGSETVVRAKERDSLTNAVRLTREAVVAWASLLHGPAVLTINR